MSGAGFGLKLHDTAFGTNHCDVYLDWVRHARGAYLGLDGVEPPRRVTMYYDPLLDLHMRTSVAGATDVALFLAGIAPGEARALYDASIARTRLVDADPVPPRHPKSAATTLFLAKEWGLQAHAERVAAAIDAHYEPTWDAAAGEFTWGLGLGERHPRGQYNAFLAAAEANSEGAWARLAGQGIARGEGEITGVDFPDVACREARWQDGALHCRLVARRPEQLGRPTSFRVRGLAQPDAWRATSASEVGSRVEGADLLVTGPLSEDPIRIGR